MPYDLPEFPDLFAPPALPPLARVGLPRRKTSFDPLNSLPGLETEPPTPPPLPEPEPDAPGWLATIGDVLDRPGNAVRGLLDGRLDPLKGLIPFSETLGLYDPRKNHVSGQDVLHDRFGLEKSDDFFSLPGLAGFATEIATDPLNLLPGMLGIKAATAEGRAARLLGGHLDEATRAAQAALRANRVEKGLQAAEHIAGGVAEDVGRAAVSHPVYGDLLDAGGKFVGDRAVAERLASSGGELGGAARQTLDNAATRGLGDEALRYLPEAGDRVNAGQEALLSVGGHYDPFGLFRMGGKFNPVNWLPEVPGLTAPLELPQKTLIEGAGAAQGIQDFGRGIGNLPGIRDVAKLFEKTPGVNPASAAAIEEAAVNARKQAQFGRQEALRGAEGLDERLAGLRPGESVNPATGEILDAAPVDPRREFPPPLPEGTETPDFYATRQNVKASKPAMTGEAELRQNLTPEPVPAQNLTEPLPMPAVLDKPEFPPKFPPEIERAPGTDLNSEISGTPAEINEPTDPKLLKSMLERLAQRETEITEHLRQAQEAPYPHTRDQALRAVQWKQQEVDGLREMLTDHADELRQAGIPAPPEALRTAESLPKPAVGEAPASHGVDIREDAALAREDIPRLDAKAKAARAAGNIKGAKTFEELRDLRMRDLKEYERFYPGTGVEPPAKLDTARDALNRATDKLGLPNDPLNLRLPPEPPNVSGLGGDLKASLSPGEAVTVHSANGPIEIPLVGAERLLTAERHVQTIARELGLNVHFAENLPGGANGIWAAAEGESRVVLKAGMSPSDLAHTFGHEVTHQALREIGGAQADVVLSAAQKVLGPEYAKLASEIKTKYLASGFELTDKALVEELLADAGGKLFRDDGLKFISEAAKLDPTIIDKIVAHIQDAVQKIATYISRVNPSERQQLEAIVDRLHKVQFGLTGANEELAGRIAREVEGAPRTLSTKRLSYIVGDAGALGKGGAGSTDALISEARSVAPKASLEPADAYLERQGRIEALKAKIKGTPAAQVAAKDVETLRQLEEIQGGAKAEARVSATVQKMGKGTVEAAHSATALDAKLDPSLHRHITEMLETRGMSNNPEAQKVIEELRGKYDQWLDLEKKAGLDSTELKSPERGLDYAPHIPTAEGDKFFAKMGKTPAKQAEYLLALENKRIEKGVKPNPERLRTMQEQRLAMGGMRPAEQQQFLAKRYNAEGAKRFLSMPQAERDAIFKMGQLPEFMDFATQGKISTMHGSQIARKPWLRELTVAEINDAGSEVGGVAQTFNEHPGAQQFAREARHVKVMAGKQFFDQLAEKLGREMPAGFHEGGIVGADGLEKMRDPAHGDSWGVPELNTIRRRQGLPTVGFDSPEVAAAARDTFNRMQNPEEVGALLGWYDKATQFMKANITKGFPAFHVRNHISNKIQSWLGGVPVSGEHAVLANKALAGKELSVAFGDGTRLDREALLKEAQRNGVTTGGQFEQLVKDKLDESRGGGFNLNPFDKDNDLLKTAEKIGAGIAGGPGRLAVGGSLKDIDGKIVEDTDRLAHYIHRRMTGWAPAAAAQDVDKFLFDYSKESLSPWEQKYASRAVFFYGYTRNVIPMILDVALNDTKRLKPISQLAIQPGQPDFKPKYLEDGVVLPTGKDADGNSKAIYTLGTPLEAALEPFTKNPLNSLNPILKAPLELASGQDFFMGRPIEDLKKAPHWAAALPGPLQDLAGVRHVPGKDGADKVEMDPFALWALRSSPASRISNTLSRATDERKDATDILGNLLTGTRMVSIDDDEERARAQKEAIRQRLRELSRKGKAIEKKFTLDNFSQADKAAPDAEVAGLLKALRP